MASPFVEDLVELAAQIMRGSLRSARVFRDRQDPLDLLYERYRFSSEGMRYLCQLLEPYVASATRQSCALTVPQTVCIALWFFATGTFLHAMDDAENLSKNMVCNAIHKVIQALKELLDVFVVFPGHLPTQSIKENFYKIAGKVIGALDCTHIPISARPGENEGDYINRKSFHSLNVQAGGKSLPLSGLVL
ncbi:putative nuclease HARBI1 [Thunnus thynnus]|uniref:putative nuclease HARBI1 n=1 Tax=Thunnus thynnus TaxID=8237 RepID=UPI00352965E3